MQIDEKAPVISRGSIEVEAPAELIWDLIADIEQWPRWNREVKSATLHGPVNAGTEFTWKAGPGKIRSRLENVDRPHEIGWSGSTLGIGAVHIWRVEPGEAACQVSSEESWHGFMPGLFRGPAKRMLDKTTRTGLQLVKLEAERRASQA